MGNFSILPFGVLIIVDRKKGPMDDENDGLCFAIFESITQIMQVLEGQSTVLVKFLEQKFTEISCQTEAFVRRCECSPGLCQKK
jgi:hypothetical protein